MEVECRIRSLPLSVVVSNIECGVDLFFAGGYNHLMGKGPLATRMAWNARSTGFPNTMSKVEVNLGALAGQTAIFRWYFRADDLNADEAVGWWVDDIQFTNLTRSHIKKFWLGLIENREIVIGMQQ